MTWKLHRKNSTPYISSDNTTLCRTCQDGNLSCTQTSLKDKDLPSTKKMIPGKTDTNTFFATIASTRKFEYVQLIFCHQSQLLYAQCMKEELNSHKAYQDFIHTIGTPTLLVTKNKD